jgi:hypothetical protein
MAVKTVQKHIIITEHPSVPCSRLYEDVFHTIIVECRHLQHNNPLDQKEGEGNHPSPKQMQDPTTENNRVFVYYDSGFLHQS